MSHEQSRRDLHRESQHPNQAQPSPAHLSTPPTHPIHPTTTTSTHATPTLDGTTNIRDIYEERYAEREERPTTDQSQRPVSHLVARDRSEVWSLSDEAEAIKRDRARLIVELHGAHRETDSLRRELERKGESIENRDDLLADLRAERDAAVARADRNAAAVNANADMIVSSRVELGRTEGDLAVAVREANHHRALVAEAVRLHQADAVDPDWCASCATTAWPCPTSVALGGGSDA